MEEADAQAWIRRQWHVPRETMARLERLAALVAEENEQQNLVSRASLQQVWVRHIADSAQLLLWAPANPLTWLDLGSGAGFPGLVVALVKGGPVTLIEERKLRAEFLRRAAAELGLADEVDVIGARAQSVGRRTFDVISARAFAPLPKLLELGTRFSTAKTRWILPKGRNARSELESVESAWQGAFRLEPSVTDPEAGIIVAEGVKRKRA